MPWSSGTYSRTNGTHTGSTTWAQDEAAGTDILSSRHDTHDQDLATGINSCINKDGSNAFTGDADIGSNKVTSVANATARTDAPNVGQVQDQGFTWCGTAGGSKNALTLSPSPAITAYAAGQRFRFIAGGTDSDDATTIAVSGLITKAIEINGAALSASVFLEAGKLYEIDYDGTAFQATRLSGSPVTAASNGGAGISGGAVSVDPNNATDATITASDEILFADADDSNNVKKDTVQGILDLVGNTTDQIARDMAASALAYSMAQNDSTSVTGSIGRFYLSDDFESDSLSTSTNATYDASGDYYHNPGTSTLIAQGTGTPIGDMTSGGGASAAYDGNNDQAQAACATTTGSVTVSRIGKDYGSGTERVVTGMKTWGANNDGYNTAGTGTMTLVLKASNTDPTGTGWTGDTIATIAAFTDGSTANAKETLDNANATAYRYVWCELTASVSGFNNMAEIEFYEAGSPPNMTLAPSTATLDTADPSDLLAYIVIDPQESITAGTDIVMTMSIDGGTTDATGSWTKVGDIGATGEELWRVEADVSGQTGSSLTYEITTANNKEIRFHDVVGIVAIY